MARAAVVGMRRDLRELGGDVAALRPLDADLRALLTVWFDPCFLELRRITWDSPASLLERLAQREAVHPVAGWEDLKNRLDRDRRIFCLFHPRSSTRSPTHNRGSPASTSVPS